MRLIPQYRMLTRTSNGVEHTDMMFLASKRARLYVRSASKPRTMLAKASARPIMVRNWNTLTRRLVRGIKSRPCVVFHVLPAIFLTLGVGICEEPSKTE